METVADFSLPSTSGSTFSLAAARGTVLVLYFYPKDSTPGCTTEARQFRDAYGELRSLGAEIRGISRDSIASHERFKDRLGLPFELLSDAEEKVCAQFGVIRMKNLYGRQVRGIERSTFVIDREGVLRRQWRGVKADGHAREVLDFLRTL